MKKSREKLEESIKEYVNTYWKVNENDMEVIIVNVNKTIADLAAIYHRDLNSYTSAANIAAGDVTRSGLIELKKK